MGLTDREKITSIFKAAEGLRGIFDIFNKLRLSLYF